MNKPARPSDARLRFNLAQILLLVIPVLLVLIIDADSFILVSIADTDIQMRLWLALLVLLIVLPFIGLFKSTASLLTGQWYKQRQTIRDEQRLYAGLNSYLEADWHNCVAQFKPLNRKNHSMISLLFGARAAKQLGKDKLAQQWLNSAKALSSPHQIAADLEQINQLIAAGEFEAADDCIKSLPSTDHKHLEIARFKTIIESNSNTNTSS